MKKLLTKIWIGDIRPGSIIIVSDEKAAELILSNSADETCLDEWPQSIVNTTINPNLIKKKDLTNG